MVVSALMFFQPMFYLQDDSKDQLRKEDHAHASALEFLRNELGQLERLVKNDNATYHSIVEQLENSMKRSSQNRDANLKELLQLRLLWQAHEKSKEALIREKEKQALEHELIERRQAAAEVIQEKLRKLYKAKYSSKKNTDKKKTKSGKKGKKKTPKK